MSEYQPGTVAVATVNDKRSVRVFRADPGEWVSASLVNGTYYHDGHRVTDIRPLVVLDPEDYEAVRGVVQNSNYLQPGELVKPLTQALQRGLRPLAKPPRIPEPGLWGVVRDAAGVAWVRLYSHGSIDWHSEVRRCSSVWDQIDSPTLVREGLS